MLKRAYAVPRGEIAAALQGLLSEELFQIEGREAVQRALDQFERGKGDFSDYLLGETGRALDAETTFTFERHLRDGEPSLSSGDRLPLMRRPAALVFDLDGTLIDSRRDLATAVNLVRASYGLEQLPSRR